MRFKGLDLNLLVALDALIEERSVSRAADRLHLSQPAMSAALTRLRGFFKDQLLSLDGKKMIPTAYALRLQPKIKQLLNQASGVISTSSTFDPATSSRHFSLGVSDYLAIVLLRTLLPALERSAPKLTFDLVQPSDIMMTMLERGELDLAIVPEEHCTDDHPREFLLEEAHVAIGCSSNPMFANPITVEQFSAAGHVATDFGGARPSAFADKHLARAGVERRIEVLVPSFSLMPEMVLNTTRIAVIHERLAHVFAQRLPITISPIPFEFPVMREIMQFHRSRHDDAGLNWLKKELRRNVPEVAPVA